MRTLVDSSALFALLNADDRAHDRATSWFRQHGGNADEHMLTHNYVVLEAASLVMNWLGPHATRRLLDTYIPALTVIFVDESIHDRAVAAHLASLRRGGVSLVDRVSFEVIRDRQLDRAFAFDGDFAREGFAVVP